MTLEPNVFEDICRALGAIPEPEAELRRRRSRRFQVDREVSVKRHGVQAAAARALTLLNLSDAGLCVVDRMAVSAGAQLVVALPMGGGGSLNVVCTVRQCRLTATGAFRIGAEFTSQSEQDSRIIRGAEGIVAASAADSGASQADVNQPALAQITRPDGSTAQIKVHVSGFREGKFSIVAPQPIPIGEGFILEFHSIDERVHLWRCVVTDTQAAGSHKYSVTARNEGAVAPPRGSLRAWFKRHFGTA